MVEKYETEPNTASKTADEMMDVLKNMFSSFTTMSSSSERYTEDSKLDEVRENVADICKFHNDILWEYDNIDSTENSTEIQIYFG